MTRIWTINQDYHASGAIEVFEEVFESLAVPILVAHVGRYPTATAEDGSSTRDSAHVLISIAGGSVGAQQYYNGVHVQAVGTYTGSIRRQLPVFQDILHHETGENADPTPDRWVSIGKQHIGAAITTLNRLDGMFAAANAIIARAWEYSGALSREEYVKACADCKVETISDEDIVSSYGIKYGEFSYPQYEPEYVAQMHLAARRLRWFDESCDHALARAKTSVPASFCVAPSGQLWEPCEICGAEPVQMPLHLCAKCWPH